MSSLIDWLVENEPAFRKTRLPSLYSDLAVQKTSNPEGYAANVTAWQAALTRAALAGQLPFEQRLILQTSDDLLNALASPHYGRPSGLGCVLDDCVRHGKMIDLQDFLVSEKSIYNRSWLPSPWAILRWSLRQVGIVGTASYEVPGGRLKKGGLVLVPALEEVWKKMQVLQDTQTQSLTDRIVSRDLFLKEMNSLFSGPVSLSDQDINVLLRYLARDKHALSYDDTTIKFKSPAAPMPEPITQEDHSIASLKTLIANLNSQIENLTSRISTLQSNAQIAVKTGNKASALSALRSKKLAERSLQSRIDTLHQLEEVYTKIEAAVDQVEVVAAMEASAGVLKTLNKKIGGVERVDDVLDSLREEMSKVDEVSGVVADPLAGNAVLDEAEVDDELENMEREERIKREEKSREQKKKLEIQEAEVTRRRLAELEGQPAAQAPSTESEKNKENMQIADVDLERSLSSSIDKLQKLDIDGLQHRQNEDQQHQQPQKVAEGT
ncbi:hypothetical protein A1O1_09277 [Capronia coronata CBS 617.96]|uniref:Charged multivesicular body protein 7 n=1 Tax=Capronia coronata CBS 617.96 TaxID=1182541 RepID=W9XNJ4_9EURO|nr:uncharacterized protein A1O1_09277 [Capronia coronata CBS 617.96]EXJ78875.1 hypothetical protein A1O1_09277 [Capronia coronata CBS 617.96]